MFKSLALGFAAVLCTGTAAFAQDAGTSEAALPRSEASALRLAPVAGASSFTTAPKVNTSNFDQGFSAGLLADFGSGAVNFETGVLTLQSSSSGSGNQAAVRVNTWGIPILAKFNLSGNPHQTVFLKVGGMPFNTTGDAKVFNVMAVGGIGGNIPLGRNSSLVLDASYNRLFTNAGNLTNYQGIALLGGLSFNI